MTKQAIEVQVATPHRHYGALGHNGSDARIQGGSADAPVRVMTQAQLVDLRAAQRTFVSDHTVFFFGVLSFY